MSKRVANKKGSTLSDWSGIIARQAEASRKVQDTKVAAMRKGLRAQIAMLKKHDNELLLDTLLNAHAKQGSYDPREGEIWTKLYKAARKEILHRLIGWTD